MQSNLTITWILINIRKSRIPTGFGCGNEECGLQMILDAFSQVQHVRMSQTDQVYSLIFSKTSNILLKGDFLLVGGCRFVSALMRIRFVSMGSDATIETTPSI